MGQGTEELIPIRGFGQCRWCGTEGTKLQYLMCPNCFNIAGMMPSKVNVVMNQPGVKKSLEGQGINIRTITPEVVKFLLDPKNKFPPGIDAKEHWDCMLDEAVEYVSDDDIAERFAQIKKQRRRQGLQLPDEDEIAEVIGMESTIRFFLLYCVIRGLIKIEMSVEDKQQLQEYCEECIANATFETPRIQTKEKAASTPQPDKLQSMGMNIKKRT